MSRNEKKTRHDLILRLVKSLIVLLMTGVFAAGWFGYYAQRIALPYHAKGNALILALFLLLFVSFGRVYDAFVISTCRISERIYSLLLAALAADGVMFVITWLLTRRFPAVQPMVLVLAGQALAATVWSYWSHHWYFRTFPPRSTAIVYDVRPGMEKLLGEYGLDKKYDVRYKLSVQEALDRLELLKRVETVFLSGVHSHDRNVLLKYCIAHDVEVLVIPRLGDIAMSGAHPIHMFHLPMLRLRRYDASPEYLFFKRAMDIVLSLLALIVLSPVMLAVAVAIKAQDGGPVIYSHMRLTKDGKLFRIYKFRSMCVDAEKDGVARLSSGVKDARITPVGRVIRRLRLDELPQLVNILKGEMSLVGPRPERPELAAEYMQTIPEFALRLQCKAGLTGYAQVYGKYNTSPYDKLQMDMMYIARPSLIEDIKIILATVKILFMPESTEGIGEGRSTSEVSGEK